MDFGVQRCRRGSSGRRRPLTADVFVLTNIPSVPLNDELRGKEAHMDRVLKWSTMLLLIAAAACTTTTSGAPGSISERPATSNTSGGGTSAQPPPPPAPTAPPAIKLRGHGAVVKRIELLESTPLVVAATHDGESNFIVELIPGSTGLF